MKLPKAEVTVETRYDFGADGPVVTEAVPWSGAASYQLDHVTIHEYDDSEVEPAVALVGYKLTKSGQRPKRSQYPETIINHELEAEVLAAHRERSQ